MKKLANNKLEELLVLALDTSCDETSAAVTCGERILSNIVASQIKIHRRYGGVDPLKAKRAHQQLLEPVIDEALKEAGIKLEKVKAIAVTIGPGLAIALEVGVAKAKELAKNYRKPPIAVDHMEGHLLSPFARSAEGKFGIAKPEFPALGLLVSGGHTELVLMKDFGEYRLVGQTLDDAAGECFDKVAKILGLGYPGGPIISKLAQEGDPNAFDFPVPMSRIARRKRATRDTPRSPELVEGRSGVKDSGDYNFSFSGLKTACLYKRQELGVMSQEQVANFCASFERVVIAHLTDKLILACREFKPKVVLLGGGVVANRQLQERVKQEMKRLGIPVYLPYESKLLTDNAAMIGVVAHFKAKRNEFVKDVKRLERIPDLSLG